MKGEEREGREDEEKERETGKNGGRGKERRERELILPIRIFRYATRIDMLGAWCCTMQVTTGRVWLWVRRPSARTAVMKLHWLTSAVDCGAPAGQPLNKTTVTWTMTYA